MNITERKALRVRTALAAERQRCIAEGKKHRAEALSEIELNSRDEGLARLYDLIMDTGLEA